MHIERLILGPLQTNCYLVSEEENSDFVLVIDPAANGSQIREKIGNKKIPAVFLTHGHADHTGGLMAFKDCPIYIHEEDALMLNSPNLNVGAMLGDYAPRPAASHLLKDGDSISLEGFSTPITVMHTPGHTAGSCCFQMGSVIFTGDTLFQHGYGRTDFPTGNFHQLRESLRKLLSAKEDADIYPGHGEFSTLFLERGRT